MRKPPDRHPNSWSTSITLIDRQAPAFHVQVSYIPRAWRTCSGAFRIITRTMISGPTWKLPPWRTTDCNSGLARRYWRIRIKSSVMVSINLDAGTRCTNMILEFLGSRSIIMSRFGLVDWCYHLSKEYIAFWVIWRYPSKCVAVLQNCAKASWRCILVWSIFHGWKWRTTRC